MTGYRGPVRPGRPRVLEPRHLLVLAEAAGRQGHAPGAFACALVRRLAGACADQHGPVRGREQPDPGGPLVQCLSPARAPVRQHRRGVQDSVAVVGHRHEARSRTDQRVLGEGPPPRAFPARGVDDADVDPGRGGTPAVVEEFGDDGREVARREVGGQVENRRVDAGFQVLHRGGLRFGVAGYWRSGGHGGRRPGRRAWCSGVVFRVASLFRAPGRGGPEAPVIAPLRRVLGRSGARQKAVSLLSPPHRPSS